MKKVFIRTKNVEKFTSLMDNLQNVHSELSKIAVVYGEPGTGKTFIIHRWALNNKAVYIRAANKMTTCWLLHEMAEELCLRPHFSTQNNYEAIIKSLKLQKRIIFIDEVDYLCGHNNLIETLRDIHDVTGCPIVFVGMEKLDLKISRYAHLQDRIYEKLKFEYFSKEELQKIVSELTDIEFTENAIEYLSTRNNQFRQIMKLIEKAEKYGLRNDLNKIDEYELKGLINDRRNKSTTIAMQAVKQICG